ncbi:hypothetical protein SS37A_38350 (plasmid) [Methylocystis iwaonis]|uniref:Uncharacterized protein n=1 Tax=Methylocystis iwaonis TaxID=2885079 RepID=A0ABN6VPR6_9HYPH|nr:hypothetical protein SS37A_38350 [Methylocystis iwaonis]
MVLLEHPERTAYKDHPAAMHAVVACKGFVVVEAEMTQHQAAKAPQERMDQLAGMAEMGESS